MGFWEEAQAMAPQLTGLREEFHRHPEASRQEFWTAERIERELDDIGITDHRRVEETGVYAVFHGEKPGERIITLRADIDALAMQDEKTDVPYCSQIPGRMHACGHDAHAAGLLGGARLLYAHRAEFGGEVRLFSSRLRRSATAAGSLSGRGCWRVPAGCSESTWPPTSGWAPWA